MGPGRRSSPRKVDPMIFIRSQIHTILVHNLPVGFEQVWTWLLDSICITFDLSELISESTVKVGGFIQPKK